jgi:hypothetical protein
VTTIYYNHYKRLVSRSNNKIKEVKYSSYNKYRVKRNLLKRVVLSLRIFILNQLLLINKVLDIILESDHFEI